jgi:hypothetical protein
VSLAVAGAVLTSSPAVCVTAYKQANADMAAALGFPAAAAVTCVKPSGTVSQLCDSASGIHPRHSEYYIRRVRCNKDDPLTGFMLQVCVLCLFVCVWEGFSVSRLFLLFVGTCAWC